MSLAEAPGRARNRVEYGPAPETSRFALEWLQDGARTFGHFVDGGWTEGGGRTTSCPADGLRLAEFAQGTEDDVDRAVRAARAALPAWQSLGGHGRARHIYALARQIQKRSRLFAVLESLDNGKTIREARDLDIPLAARHFHHHAGWAQLLDSEFPHHQAVGVAGQIIPWNFPLLMLAWKVAPALAAGCTVVLKPAEQTPLTALLFAEVADETGLPPGVLNIVTGDGATGAALVRHPGIDKAAFTGSTEVGREIRRATAGTGKRLSLELGGKSPFVVFDSADLDAAVEGVVDGVWLNQGQVCCAGSRLLVQESVEDEMLALLRARMERIRVGHPLDKCVDMGAVVDAVQMERIQGFLDEGLADGAELWKPERPLPDEGCFLPPILCTGAPPGSRIAREEVFGPVLVSHTFRTPAEAVVLANDTRYGLSASLWTEDLSLALEVAPAIKAGTVWVNCTNRFDAAAGFGGYRESGFGREGGREGMMEYLAAEGAERVGSGPDATGAGGDLRPEQTTVRDNGSDKRAAERENGRRDAATVRGSGRDHGSAPLRPMVDRTRKLWIGGRQKRPDGGLSLVVRDASGAPFAEAPRGNRKDVRNAVEAAAKARAGWAAATGYLRAQILYFAAENLAARADDFAETLRAAGSPGPRREVDAAVRATFAFAALADKHDGRVHATPYRNVTFAMNEPVGAVGIRCGDGAPLAGSMGAIAAAISQGNVVVLVASERHPLPALELVQVLETSDIPPGVVNIVSGLHREVVPTLAAHDDVDHFWDFAADSLSGDVERLSAGNLKRTWVDWEALLDWRALAPAALDALTREATHVKNIWVPYGV